MGTSQIIFVNKKLQSDIVELDIFRKHQRFTDKPRQALPQGVVPAFGMRGLPCFFTHRLVIFPKNALVGLPKITEGVCRLVGFWDGFPEFAATFGSSAACKPRNGLAGAAAGCRPHPAGIGLALGKRPQPQHVSRLCRH